jgi:hypothetical protein
LPSRADVAQIGRVRWTVRIDQSEVDKAAGNRSRAMPIYMVSIRLGEYQIVAITRIVLSIGT